jgi:hypothetical protein
LDIGWATSSDGERDFAWVWLGILDFPIVAIYFRFVSITSGHLIAITSFFLGGAQWLVIGAGCDLLRRFLIRRSALRATRNI